MDEWECYEKLYGRLAEWVYFGISGINWVDIDDWGEI